MKNAERADSRAARRFAIPQESMGPGPRITISGGSHVLVEGLRALEEYAEDKVTASVHRGSVIIRGEGLHLDAMSEHELSVSGRIWGVELE